MVFWGLQPGWGQRVQVLKNHIPSIETYLPGSHSGYFMLLLAIEHGLQDSVSHRNVYLTDLHSYETFLLNQCLSGSLKSDKLAQLVASDNLDFDLVYQRIRWRLDSLSPDQKLKLHQWHFLSADPVISDMGTNASSQAHYIMAMLYDYFSEIPSDSAPVALQSIRSFLKLQEVKRFVSDSEDQEALASFSDEATLAYCRDSLHELEKLVAQYKIPYWDEVKGVLLGSSSEIYVTKELVRFYDQLSRTLTYLLNFSDSSDLWILTSKLKEQEALSPEFSFASMLVDKAPKLTFDTLAFSQDSLHEIYGICTLNGEQRRYPMPQFKEKWHIEHEVEEVVPSSGSTKTYFKRISLPYFSFGVIANQSLYPSHFLKGGSAVNGFPPVDPGSTLGLEASVVDDDGIFTVRYLGQNQWLNWHSVDHFSIRSVQLAWLMPVYETSIFQNYLGLEYEFGEQRLSMPVSHSFFGSPENAPKVLTNNIHGLGCVSRSIFSWKGFYLSIQCGYRFDVSDGRWSWRGAMIHGESTSSLSGFNGSIGAGFTLGSHSKRIRKK
jgi:hypothetical protein